MIHPFGEQAMMQGDLRVAFIFNPIANGGRAQRWLAPLQDLARPWAQDGVWWLTQKPGHARVLARQAAQEGFHRVVAFGGDGTVHEVVNGLMEAPEERRPVLGIVPIGAGNDFAYAVGFSANPQAALHRSLVGPPQRVDLGYVRDDRGREAYWDNTLGIGFDAVVNLRSRKLRFLKGFWRYLVAVLQTLWFHHRAMPMHLVWDDVQEEERSLLMLVLCNGPREGGAFLVAPEARPDDRIFHYAFIPQVTRMEMLFLIPKVMRGTHVKDRRVTVGAFRTLRLRAQGPLYIHLDGEVFADFQQPARELEVRLLPQALRVAGEPSDPPGGSP